MKLSRLWFLILILVVSLLLSSSLFFVANKVFVLKKIELIKDFDLDNEKLYKFLDIKSDKYIWEYNVREMEKKLSTQNYLDNYEVKIKYPDTISICMKIRVPIAQIIDTDNTPVFIDKYGLIFKESNYKGVLPLIINEKKDKIFVAKKINNRYFKVIDVLNDLKNRYNEIYESVSQIEILDKSGSNIHYVVNYTAINKKIYLKNQINVDLIREGLVTSLFLDNEKNETKVAQYSGIGFVY